MSDVKRITVIGAGTMGHGIAHIASAVGYDVVLHDVSEERVEKGLEAIRASLAKGIAKGKVSPEQREATLSGIRTSTDLREAVEAADLVVEAVPESLDLKRGVLRDVDEAAPAGAVLATNTSSLSVARIAEVTGRPEDRKSVV